MHCVYAHVHAHTCVCMHMTCIYLYTSTQATFAVHSRKRAVIGDLVVVGDGVWISFLQDSTLRLYNGTTFTHMQDLNISPAVRRNISTLCSYPYPPPPPPPPSLIPRLSLRMCKHLDDLDSISASGGRAWEQSYIPLPLLLNIWLATCTCSAAEEAWHWPKRVLRIG